VDDPAGRRVKGQLTGRIQGRDHLGRGIGVHRSRGGDQELVIQERAAESRVEEVIVHRVLLGEQSFGQAAGVEVAHHQAGIIAPGDELVHRAAVDLRLLLEKAVNDVAGFVLG
jgi:hypothetical protein